MSATEKLRREDGDHKPRQRDRRITRPGFSHVVVIAACPFSRMPLHRSPRDGQNELITAHGL
ncbi:hypothetical protein ACFVTT_33325 [Streptomyces niveus]|uniref:hypothetical protein n=1 Tax=Streptomyces niveus TaxID=193462 RepID=UPI003425C5FD